MRRINQAGLNLIKSFEGLYLKPYLCPARVPTIGYGTIQYPDGRKVTLQDPPITEQQATEYLEHELVEKQLGVERLVTVPINDNQFSALVSFTYNLGVGALQKSTLLKLLNAGNVSGAADEFLKWNKAAGQVLSGLTRRREAERSLFLQSSPVTKGSGHLPDGPTDQEINDKLKDIEKDII